MATDGTNLGDRMKKIESQYRHKLTPKRYVLLRLDGRAFHTHLRNARKPFDSRFSMNMTRVAEYLCANMMNARLAYTQSDEISILMTDWEKPNTEQWMGGVEAKIISLSASMATAKYNFLNYSHNRPRALPDEQLHAQFDSRVFQTPYIETVFEYFAWRHKDATKNSISMLAQAHYSPRQLHGKKSGEMLKMLREEKDIHWEDVDDIHRFGAFVVKKSGELPVTYTRKDTGETITESAYRTWWATEPAYEDIYNIVKDNTPKPPTFNTKGPL